MSLFHAIAFVDHHTAQVRQFDAEHVQKQTVHQNIHVSRHHASGVRTEHEFFGKVCDALEGTAEVLIVGGHMGLADFRHYAHKHRPLTAKHIVGYEVVDHPSEREVVALARKHFVKFDPKMGMSASA